MVSVKEPQNVCEKVCVCVGGDSNIFSSNSRYLGRWVKVSGEVFKRLFWALPGDAQELVCTS